jgi:hypothetical protein
MRFKGQQNGPRTLKTKRTESLTRTTADRESKSPANGTWSKISSAIRSPRSHKLGTPPVYLARLTELGAIHLFSMRPYTGRGLDPQSGLLKTSGGRGWHYQRGEVRISLAPAQPEHLGESEPEGRVAPRAKPQGIRPHGIQRGVFRLEPAI